MKPAYRNISLALSLLMIVAGMGMMAYASVPLYRMFCQVTGFGGRAQATLLKLPAKPLDRTMTVEFDSNVNPALPWEFKPLQREVTVKIGQREHIQYQARNTGSIPYTGTATFNITPVKAGVYFDKIQCFCFTQQTLKPGETKTLDVTFFIDPAINDDRNLDEVHTITLSYTFFPLKK
jgi:cytochrome c oxidase assembly protein subunit 11